VVEAGADKASSEAKQNIAHKLFQASKVIIHNSRIVLLSYSVFIVTCILVYFLETQDPAVFGLLDLSKSNYWGPVTSIFLHFSLQHLEGNMVVLFYEMWILAVLLNTNSYRNNERVKWMFFWSPLGAAILANVVFFFRAPLATSAGASGFDYAVMGLTIMVAVFGITSGVRSVGLKSYFASRKHRSDFLMNALFAVALLAFIFLAPAVFLGVGGGVNAFVHGFSLIFELFFTIAYFWFSGSL
jgi:membrane associated rhomboid family serine protease